MLNMLVSNMTEPNSSVSLLDLYCSVEFAFFLLYSLFQYLAFLSNCSPLLTASSLCTICSETSQRAL